MSRDRSLMPNEVTKILNWGKRWRRVKTLKHMASKYGVSESTIRRIVDAGGYTPPKQRPDIDELVRSIDSFSSVPRGTNQVGEHS